jgi:ketosteroid isomerase-like protein
MTQENVEVVRRAWEAATSKPPNWPVVNALYHREHELITNWGGVNDTVYRGAGGFEASLLDQDETWDDWRQELLGIVDAGNDSVVLETRLVGRGKHSAIPIDASYGVVVTLREGRIVRTQAYDSLEAALDAAGLGGRTPRAPQQ